MSDHTNEQVYGREKDEEVEIVSLDQPETPVSSLLLLTTRMSRRRRTMTLRVAVLLSFLLLMVLVLPTANLGNVAADVVQQWFPHPVLNLSADGGSFPIEGGYYIDTSVPWTQVSIDGKRVRIPAMNRDVPLVLGSGRHLITWSAAPFVTQLCTLSVPTAASDTCATTPDALLQQLQDVPTQILLLRNGLRTLPPSQQSALIQAAQAAFAQIQDSQLVQSGELYASTQGYTKATQRLHAALHFTFDSHVTGNRLYEVAGQWCQQLCIVPWHYLQPQIAVPFSGVSWLALGYISSYWDYTTDDGRVIAHGQAAVPSAVSTIGTAGTTGIGKYPVMLRVLWTGSAWQVTPLIGVNQAPPIVLTSVVPHRPPTPADKVRLFDNPACMAARFLYSTVGTSYANVNFISSPHLAAGCLAVVNNGSGLSTATYYFEHLGVLLAANTNAHTAQPQLPLADPYEHTLVDQLLALI